MRFKSFTPVFETLWKFSTERQRIFLRRLDHRPPPWTKDRIFLASKFTNCYRCLDRVSQYLIGEVIQKGPQDTTNVFFRILLFKIFNKIETWEEIRDHFGEPNYSDFTVSKYNAFLNRIREQKAKIWSNAYLMTSTHTLGYDKKHEGYLHVLDRMIRKDDLPTRVRDAKSFEEIFNLLLNVQLIGHFLAYQYTLDICYSDLVEFDENEFVAIGPGTRRGILKCFAGFDGEFEDAIRWLRDQQEHEYLIRGLAFPYLPGRLLTLADFANLMCEVDKYSRVAHPNIKVGKHRPGYTPRIKQRFHPLATDVKLAFPKKWKVDVAKLKRQAHDVEEPR